MNTVNLTTVKKILKTALPTSYLIESVWHIQGCIYGYQLNELPYSNKLKIVDNEAVLLN